MSNIININKNEQPQSPEAVRDQAALWVARFSNRYPKPSEIREFEDWLERDPLHRNEFLYLASLWTVLDELSAEALHAAGMKNSAGKNTGRKHFPLLGATVTVLAIVTLLVAALLWDHKSPAMPDPDQYTLTQRTAIGEISSLTLPDDSLVQLNTDSAIEVLYTPAARIVHLQKGQAQFEVQGNPQRPFIVHAGRHVVQAIGTAFSVYLTDAGALEMIVSRGRIRVATYPKPIVTLEPQKLEKFRNDQLFNHLVVLDTGHHAVISDRIELVERIDLEEIGKRLSWRNNVLAFNGDRLEDVIRELARYTSKRFVILDEELQDFRVGAYFRAGDITSVLQTFESGLGIRVEEADNQTVYLSKKR